MLNEQESTCDTLKSNVSNDTLTADNSKTVKMTIAECQYEYC